MPKEVYTLADLRNWREATADATPPLRLAVFGDPVAHSKSPAMHNAALAALGIDARYTRLHIHPDELAEAVRLLPGTGFIGANFTIPHKFAALDLMDEVDERARKTASMNTVLVDNGKLRGFSTDGPGLVRAVRAEFGVDLRDLRVMLLGAGGGAGRAIAVQCGLENCERLVLVNRTFEKAQALAVELVPFFQAAKFTGPVARLEAVPWDETQLAFQLRHTDLVINATSMGMQFSDPSPLPESILLPHLMIYDTIYTAARTSLLRAADLAGARGTNGLSMLLHQGALSFEIWFNREAPVDVMRKALQAA
ncbi:MAG TPA: shikimate dehydrogenase [Chthoniobacteraceae bacterium]|nr:shikimate dehydrogenase [Chthoniobacteraceae bacterium]